MIENSICFAVITVPTSFFMTTCFLQRQDRLRAECPSRRVRRWPRDGRRRRHGQRERPLGTTRRWGWQWRGRKQQSVQGYHYTECCCFRLNVGRIVQDICCQFMLSVFFVHCLSHKASRLIFTKLFTQILKNFHNFRP